MLVLIGEANKPALNALGYARQLGGQTLAVHILIGPCGKDVIVTRWAKLNIDIPLLVLDSPNDSIIEPLNDFVRKVRQRNHGNSVTILLPVLAGLEWWQRFLHNRSARLIERAFENMAGVSTIRVPFSLGGDSVEKFKHWNKGI